MRWVLALACLLAMPIVAAWAAQPPYITFDPVTWEGVAYYEARVRTQTAEVRYRNESPEPIVELAMLPTEQYRIDERGCRPFPQGCGEWSDLHSNTVDFDGSGIVDSRDLIYIAQHWDAFRAVDVLELMRMWGSRVREVEGLKWYVEEPSDGL